MAPKQQENNWKAYLAHIRFWEVRAGWPRFTDEELKVCYERLGRRAALQVAESRQRPPLADEIVQALPSLLGAGTKKPSAKKTGVPAPLPLPQRRQFTGVRRQAPDDIRA